MMELVELTRVKLSEIVTINLFNDICYPVNTTRGNKMNMNGKIFRYCSKN